MTVCLNMIVKNEAHVIKRCLDSVKPFVDHWVIVDTGSTDGTQDLIRELMRDVPGELHERPWVDFGHNRTEALRLAETHADYLLFIDADEQLRVPDGFAWPQLTADAYDLMVDYDDISYTRCALVSTRLRWSWVGVLHEYLRPDPDVFTRALLDGVRIFVTHDGARSRDPDTYQKDADILLRAVEAEPTNARNVFYLAQSFRDCGRLEAAIRMYEARISLGGWQEEAWYAMYQVARLYERKKAAPGIVQHSYLRAIEYRPHRAEAMSAFAQFCFSRGDNYLGSLFKREADALPLPKDDILFVETGLYGDTKCSTK